MHMNLRSFFEFSNTEAAAVLIVVIIIVITFSLNVSLSNRNNDISFTKNDSLVLLFEKMQNELKELDNKSHIALAASNKVADIVDENGNDNRLTDQPPKKRQRYAEYIKQEKLSTSESISLNKSDTADWKKVPGIGSSYAKRIVKYRALLGGYNSVEQLKEVYGFTDELYNKILPYIKADDHVAKLDINKLEFKEILSHPYIDYDQTKAIVNLRRRKGRIESVEELGMLEEFTSEDINRITPYIAF